MGMSYNANSWPLPLRVKGNLILGLDFADSSASNGGDGDKGVVLYDGKARFDIRHVNDIENSMSLLQYVLEEEGNENDEDSESGAAFTLDIGNAGIPQEDPQSQTPKPNEQQYTNDTSTNYHHLNNYGILSTGPTILREIIQTFLIDKVLTPNRVNGDGQEMISLVCDVNYMWSMMSVLDNVSPTSRLRRRQNNVNESRRRRYLRGPSSPLAKEIERGHFGGYNLVHMHHHHHSHSRLLRRGKKFDHQQSHLLQRNLVALSQPDLIFAIPIYAKYTEVQPSSTLLNGEFRLSEIQGEQPSIFYTLRPIIANLGGD